MFRPFQPPLLRSLPHSQQRHAPPAKRRRFNEGGTSVARNDETSKTDQRDIPRKPLLAVTNPASSPTDDTKPQDGGMEGYYTVLWCSHPSFDHTRGRRADSDIPGANPRIRSTKHGTATASYPSLAATPTSTTSRAERWVEQRATRLSYPDRRCQ